MERYGVSKLLVIFFLRTLAARVDASSVIINNLCPGMVKTNLTTNLPWWARPVAWYQFRNANTADAGARSYIHGVAVVGKESHGLWYQTSQLASYSDFVRSKEGERMQEKVWAETMDILEKVAPGIGAAI